MTIAATKVSGHAETAAPPLVFVHIPKTGGTTLKAVLRCHYGSGFTRINTSGAHDPDVLRERVRTAVARPGLRVAQGHITLGVRDLLPVGARYAVILRDPIERTLSEYHHLVTRVGRWRHDWLPAPSPGLTLAECLGEGSYIPGNLQTRMLCGMISIHEPLAPDALELAKGNLRDLFSYVGTTERFEEFLALLNVELRWPTLAYEAARVAPGRLRKGDLAAAQRRPVEEANVLDRELHEYAGELLALSLKQAGPELDAELDVLRRAQSRLREAGTRSFRPDRERGSLPVQARAELAVKEWQLLQAESEINALEKRARKLARAERRISELKRELRKRTVKSRLSSIKARIG
jgi:hypothetical protein